MRILVLIFFIIPLTSFSSSLRYSSKDNIKEFTLIPKSGRNNVSNDIVYIGTKLFSIKDNLSQTIIKPRCDIKYDVNVKDKGIIIRFESSILDFDVELIEVNKGVINNYQKKFQQNELQFLELESGEYFIMLKNDTCKLIIGSKDNTSQGLIVSR